jgi:hypothetical protein
MRLTVQPWGEMELLCTEDQFFANTQKTVIFMLENVAQLSATRRFGSNPTITLRSFQPPGELRIFWKKLAYRPYPPPGSLDGHPDVATVDNDHLGNRSQSSHVILTNCFFPRRVENTYNISSQPLQDKPTQRWSEPRSCARGGSGRGVREWRAGQWEAARARG